MKNSYKNYFIILLLATIGACKSSSEPEVITPLVTSSVVETYLTKMVSIMQANSINRKRIDWDVFKTKVMDTAKGSQNIRDADVKAAITVALDLLKDSHSFYQSSNGSYISGTSSTVSCRDDTPIIPSSDSEVGYVKITGFSGDANSANNFAQNIQTTIKNADNPKIKGWIVDLRGNTGGNMWPMIAGVSPILGDGTFGYFIDPDGGEYKCSYGNGNTNGVKITEQYTLLKPNPKVAILTDQSTASSGEAVTIAFKTRENTKSYGNATCGLSTANQNYTLSDGAILYLTVSTMADRTKKLYGNRVVPDVVEQNQSLYLQQAITWLKQ
jgi:carboxyl-terminal processing protease